jgi:hypothetical protein
LKIGFDCVCLAFADFLLTVFFQEAPAIGGHGRKTPPKTAHSRQRRRLGTPVRDGTQFRDRLPAALNENDRAARGFAHQLGGAKFPDIAKPEKICVDAAVKQMLFEGRREFKDGEVELYFDRNESFRGHVYSEWAIKKRSKKPWWSDMVKTVAPARMEDTPGLQAADMVAWLLNRHYSQGDLGNWVGVVNTFLDRADRRYAGYDEIKNYHVERAS